MAAALGERVESLVEQWLCRAPSLALYSPAANRMLRRSKLYLSYWDSVKATHEQAPRDSGSSKRELWKLCWVNQRQQCFVRSVDAENSYWTVLRDASTGTFAVELIEYTETEKLSKARPVSSLGCAVEEGLEVPMSNAHGPVMHPALFHIAFDGEFLAFQHLKTDLWLSVSQDGSVILTHAYTPACHLVPAVKAALLAYHGPSLPPASALGPAARLGEEEVASAVAAARTAATQVNAVGKERVGLVSSSRHGCLVLLHRSYATILASSGKWWGLSEGALCQTKASAEAALLRFSPVANAEQVFSKNVVFQLSACSPPALGAIPVLDTFAPLVDEGQRVVQSKGGGIPLLVCFQLLPDTAIVRQLEVPMIVKLSRFTGRIQEEEPATEAAPRAPPPVEHPQGLLFHVPLADLIKMEFGALPDEAVATRLRAPQFVVDCVRYLLQERRYATEGLFRISARKLCVDRMRPFLDDAIALDKAMLLLEAEEESLVVGEHEVAALLKLFFREMPEPLLTYELFDEFVKVPSLEAEEAAEEALLVQDCFSPHEHEEEAEAKGLSPDACLPNYTVAKRTRYRALVSRRLPKCNHDTLQLLCFLLHRVMLEPTNKMTAMNLAIVFSPNVLAAPAADLVGTDIMAAMAAMKSNSGAFEVLRSLVADYYAIFGGPPAVLHDLAKPDQ